MLFSQTSITVTVVFLPPGYGDWYWYSGDGVLYENWAPDEPVDEPSVNCADMFTGTGLWHSVGCDQRRGLVCQVDVNALPPTGP